MAMNNKITESYLREVAQLAKEKDLAALPPTSELKGYHKFSEHFEQKIAEIYAMLDKPKTMSKAARRVLLVAAIIILLIVFAMSAGAIRGRLYELFLEYNETNADGMYAPVQHDDSPYVEAPEYLTTLYYPSYLPEGFEEYEQYTNDCTFNNIIFANTQGQNLSFSQKLIYGTFSVDTEDAEYIEVTDNDIIYYCLQKNGFTTIFWSQYGYSFSIVAPFSFEETLKIAKSIVPFIQSDDK